MAGKLCAPDAKPMPLKALSVLFALSLLFLADFSRFLVEERCWGKARRGLG